MPWRRLRATKASVEDLPDNPDMPKRQAVEKPFLGARKPLTGAPAESIDSPTHDRASRESPRGL
jgi:hypothetical protein